jgi:hypothetical protein
MKKDLGGVPRDVVIAAGIVVVVTCDPATVCSLDMESGRVVRREGGNMV